MTRNAPCPCGSGRRYKHCHGRFASAPPSALHEAALAAHKAGSLSRAEALYRQAIEDNQDNADSLHMLGVLQFERMRYREALDLLWDASERTGWANPAIHRNLSLVLANLLSPLANARQEALVARYTDLVRARKAGPALAARVSVVLPVRNHARSVARAIASVAAQTYADIEFIVVDDGSTDDTAAVVAQCLAGFAIPTEFVRREHQGAARAANAGAARASGRYLAFLDARDWFAPERIERMAAAIARPIPLWGFSRFICSGGDSGKDADGSAPLRGMASRIRDFLGQEPASFTLLDHDVAGSTGNLFVDRSLFHELGGYRDATRYRGWEFCVRAAEVVEPVAIDQYLYFRGEHAGDVAPGPAHSAAVTVDPMAADLVERALTRDAAVANEFCPQFAGNRDLLLRAELRAGHGDRIPAALLRTLAATWRSRAATPVRHVPRGPVHGPASRTALVVLGIYRSGTSALSRALNLCGAFLPDQVVAARLGINPKGFWETEAVNHLDARLLLHLGADWNRVDFKLPHDGPLVDDFLADARELLASEYGDAPFILIKDPRICILAPLWQRALTDCGYRPVYVVPVRNPLEVARSLEAQGDLPVAEGLRLWLAYMRCVETFADASNSDVAYVRYTALLDDWRSVLRRIARRLAVPLEIGRRADEVDRFLEAGMHNQRATDADLDAHLVGEDGGAIRDLYRRLLERCGQDEGIAQGTSAGDAARRSAS